RKSLSLSINVWLLIVPKSGLKNTGLLPCELLCVKSFDSTTSNIYFFFLKSRYTHQPRPVSFDISSSSSATFLNRDSHLIFFPLPRFGAIMKLGIFLSESSGFRKCFSARSEEHTS